MKWAPGLDADLLAAVVGLAARTGRADGVPPLSGHVLSALASDDCALVMVGAEPVGLAVVHQEDPAELFVAPEHRGRGLGAGLLASALDRAGAVWAHGDLAAARALAARFGLIKGRELLQMRRPLAPEWAREQVAAAPLPADVRLRTFVPGQDEPAFLGVNARAFAWHPEQGRLDLAGLRAEMAEPWFDPRGFFLAVDPADTVLGFHWTKVHTDGPHPIGEVYVLGVDPDATVNGGPARGLGGPLTAAGLAYLADRGLATVALYVEADNVRALRLYRRLGFQTFATDVVYRQPPPTH